MLHLSNASHSFFQSLRDHSLTGSRRMLTNRGGRAGVANPERPRGPVQRQAYRCASSGSSQVSRAPFLRLGAPAWYFGAYRSVVRTDLPRYLTALLLKNQAECAPARKLVLHSATAELSLSHEMERCVRASCVVQKAPIGAFRGSACDTISLARKQPRGWCPHKTLRRVMRPCCP